jgi:hypothetical protein
VDPAEVDPAEAAAAEEEAEAEAAAFLRISTSISRRTQRPRLQSDRSFAI